MLNYLTTVHQILITFVHANASAIAYVLAGYALISLLNLFLGQRTQVEAWVAKHPNCALLLRTLRGYGLDPWVLAKGAREYASHELIKQGPALVQLLAAALRAAFRLPLLALALLPLVSGCVGTLEESRGQLHISAASPVSARSSSLDARCQTLSDRDYWFGGVAQGGAVLTGAAGISTLPLDDSYETAAAITTLGVAGITAAAVYFERESSASYVEEGCSK